MTEQRPQPSFSSPGASPQPSLAPPAVVVSAGSREFCRYALRLAFIAEGEKGARGIYDGDSFALKKSRDGSRVVVSVRNPLAIFPLHVQTALGVRFEPATQAPRAGEPADYLFSNLDRCAICIAPRTGDGCRACGLEGRAYAEEVERRRRSRGGSILADAGEHFTGAEGLAQDKVRSAWETFGFAARAADERRDYAGAEKMLRDVVYLYPGFGRAHHRLGQALRALDRPRDAIESLEEAIARDKDDADTRIDLGYACIESGDSERGAEELKRAMEIGHPLLSVLDLIRSLGA